MANYEATRMTTSTAEAFAQDRQPRFLHAVTLILFLAAASVPTPLYRLYQREWGFSPLMLTVIFAVYALALLAALLIFGSLSDRAGRRPVILAALTLEGVALVLFLTARGIEWLVFARLIQGFATGLATTSLGAAMLDIDRQGGALTNALATIAGTAFGAVGSGLLAQYAPAPLHLGYVLLFALVVVQAIRTAHAPETITTRSLQRWSFKPRVAVPARARVAFLAMTPINVALWALSGFYLALMPSLLVTITDPAAAWLGGLAVAALMAGRCHSSTPSLLGFIRSHSRSGSVGSRPARGSRRSKCRVAFPAVGKFRARWHRLRRCLSRRAGQHRATGGTA
jgi:MFS family permease